MNKNFDGLKNFEQFIHKELLNNNHGILLRNNKRFWIGSANILDGEIEEVHTYEEAEASDFHHNFYFSSTQIEKIDDEECVIFWVDDDGVHGNWRHENIPNAILLKIEKQIKFV